MHSVDLHAWVEAAANPANRALRQAVHTVVAAVSGDHILRDSSFLKGGMLLALRYDSNRYTTDLDFSNRQAYTKDREAEIVQALTRSLPLAVEALGYDLDCRLQKHRASPKPSPQHNYINLEMTIGYAYKGRPEHHRLMRGQAPSTLSIDYNFLESVPEEEVVEISDTGTLRVYGTTTLIAEKYRAMLQQVLRVRMRRQDVYDLGFLIDRYGPFSEDKSGLILEVLISKCQEREFTPDRMSMSSAQVRERARAEYGILAQEIDGLLPDFDETFDRVKAFYEGLPW